MGYYDGDDLPYYYFMASQFATSDRWFSPAITRTHPNRMYSMAATSQGHAYPIPSGGKQLTAKTIFQLLEEHGITWKVYHGGSSSYFDMFTYANSHQDHIASLDDYMTDVQNGTLPQVAFLEPGPDTDEHPGIDPDNPGPDIQVDAKFTSGLINALMTSSSWKDSVFILSFDEAGGFYDHVPPMAAKNPDGIAPQDLRDGDICTKGETNPSNCNFDRSGYRLPLIVVSPFVKPHYVSHTPMDYTAVLKLIETRFQLPSLTARDAAQPDMTEFFDFDNVPWATPPTPPTQPIKSGVCYNDRLP
jgi:phospholipase C